MTLRKPSKFIHIFNPEADYALADFSPGYTPPESVVMLRRKLALTPAKFAGPEDVVLLLDEPENLVSASFSKSSELFFNEASCGKINFIFPSSAHAFFKKINRGYFLNYGLRPWGWNPAICKTLLNLGAPIELLPSPGFLKLVRNLSHRSITIQFNRNLNRFLGSTGLSTKHISPLPIEYWDVDECIDNLCQDNELVLKYPWSSSGRGLLMTREVESPNKIREWIVGAIRRQGSILAETYFAKILDFATEWHIGLDGAKFLGVSVFNTTPRGHYRGNYSFPQARLRQIISEVAPDFNDAFIDAQRQALNSIAQGYTGYAGIDMMADKTGAIRGGVEINFRMTMGIAALLENNSLP